MPIQPLTQPPSTTLFTVSRLNQAVRQLLETEMGQVWLSAEISNFSQPASGHWYFTLKDNTAQVRSAMFRTANRRVTFRPQNGQQVLVRATITLYEPRGDYQLIVENMQPAGDGLLQQQFEQLKQTLLAEGLFDTLHKQSLPSPAKCLGVITSATGAALHDILHVLQRRDPALPIIIYPTVVQGAEAPNQIVRAIELANLRNECDVLIVGRGGGSLEDLNAFNQESVARSIFASKIPIVSAIGHETDVTIADFVADLRAPTPSAAAELVSRNQIELLRQLQTQQQRLEIAMDYFFAHKQQHYNKLLHRLQQQHPALKLSRQQTVLLKLRQRLQESTQTQLQQKQKRQHFLQKRLLQAQPLSLVQQQQHQLQLQKYRLQQALDQQMNTMKQRFAIACSQLETVSPLATLARGYSVTTNTFGQVLRDTQIINVGETLYTRLASGNIESKITAINNK